MHATVRSVIEAVGDEIEDVCILDTEASPEHPSRGTARYADALGESLTPTVERAVEPALAEVRRLATTLGVPWDAP